MRDLHARAQEVARAIAYVRAGGPIGDEPVRPYLREVEELEAIHNAFASVGEFDDLPVRRVRSLPEQTIRDSLPFLVRK
ncbi:hypothetical protein [Nocardioides ultimimeridianus]